MHREEEASMDEADPRRALTVFMSINLILDCTTMASLKFHGLYHKLKILSRITTRYTNKDMQVRDHPELHFPKEQENST